MTFKEMFKQKYPTLLEEVTSRKHRLLKNILLLRVSYLSTNREVTEVPMSINAFLMFVESLEKLRSKTLLLETPHVFYR